MTDDAWDTIKLALPVGSHVRCRVTQHYPFGVLTAINGVPFDGLVQITDFKDDGRMTPSEYPAIDSEVVAVVLGFKDRGRQIWLGMKPSQLSNDGDTDSNRNMRKIISIGLRLKEGSGLEFFGIEEVNSLLDRGFVVVAVEEGKAIMVKSGETAEVVRLRLGGFTVNIIVEQTGQTE